VAATYDGAEMRLYVNGKPAGTSSEQSGAINYPEAASFEIGAYHDEDEFFKCTGSIMEVRLYGRALSETEVQVNFRTRILPEPYEPVTMALGPYLQFTARDKAIVSWRTAGPVPSVVEFGLEGQTQQREDPVAKTEHAVGIDGLGLNTTYQYRILLGTEPDSPRTAWYECDTAFNYMPPAISDRPSPYPDDEMTPLYEQAAQCILATTGVTRGHCVVVGCGSGRLAYELARDSRLFVTGVDTDPEALAGAREALKQAGVYGNRVTIRQIESYDKLPFTSHFANLIVSEVPLTQGTVPGAAAELCRVLRPGGIACIGQPPSAATKLERADLTAWLEAGAAEHRVDDSRGLWAIMGGPALEGVGEWSHQYGSPDNSGRSREMLLGATATNQLEVQWLGRPGPRANADRNPRTPSPLYINGRLFTQGLHRLVAMDAYNGAILWSLEIPHMERFNMPRDCSNWCVDDDYVYAAVKNACWRLSAGMRRLVHAYDVVRPAAAPESRGFEWGYVANVGDTLFGSAVREDTPYTNFWGQATAGWYDSSGGPVTFKVCSDQVFALAKDGGAVKWSYGEGVIVNPTITIADGVMYFVECRNEKVVASASRRVGMPELWQDQFLVALDAATGAMLWEKPLDTIDGTVTFYLIHANDTLLLALSHKQYHLYAFDAANGESKWEAAHDWTAGDHSGHMQHPVVAANTVYLEPCGYDIATGALVTDAMGRHEGCATYMATEGALIYRGTNRQISMWDIATGKSTFWDRLRPGCWLTTIAGGGMVLSPEGGGGCSCGGWMETSVAFMRKE
jgi:outer membrane protein assembly factor BamB/SAM-dependent methyltransferase